MNDYVFAFNKEDTLRHKKAFGVNITTNPDTKIVEGISLSYCVPMNVIEGIKTLSFITMQDMVEEASSDQYDLHDYMHWRFKKTYPEQGETSTFWTMTTHYDPKTMARLSSKVSETQRTLQAYTFKDAENEISLIEENDQGNNDFPLSQAYQFVNDASRVNFVRDRNVHMSKGEFLNYQLSCMVNNAYTHWVADLKGPDNGNIALIDSRHADDGVHVDVRTGRKLRRPQASVPVTALGSNFIDIANLHQGANALIDPDEVWTKEQLQMLQPMLTQIYNKPKESWYVKKVPSAGTSKPVMV